MLQTGVDIELYHCLQWFTTFVAGSTGCIFHFTMFALALPVPDLRQLRVIFFAE